MEKGTPSFTKLLAAWRSRLNGGVRRSEIGPTAIQGGAECEVAAACIYARKRINCGALEWACAAPEACISDGVGRAPTCTGAIGGSSARVSTPALSQARDGDRDSGMV